ncbi:MAG: MBL fold metallo-hydrolase [Candidatus Acidiferrales bacterium]
MVFYRGPFSDHFDGKKFFNPWGGLPGGGSVLKWLASRKPGSWREWIEDPFAPPPPARVSDGEIRATFVGHSTVLIQMDGANILCDPIWSKRASPFPWMGPRRHRAPGVGFEELPPIDLVLQSHDHYDHFDVPTLQRIASRWSPVFAVPLGLRARLSSKRIAADDRMYELDWWQSADAFDKLRITAVPARHFSGRGLRDRNATLWCGYMIEGASGAVYFAGDTGYGPHFGEIKGRFPNIRLAFLPIGAYLPQWFMGPVHVSPEDAVRAHIELGAATSIAIHFGTFRLADDGEGEPVVDLECALRRTNDPGRGAPRFWVLNPGEGRSVPARVD